MGVAFAGLNEGECGVNDACCCAAATVVTSAVRGAEKLPHHRFRRGQTEAGRVHFSPLLLATSFCVQLLRWNQSRWK